MIVDPESLKFRKSCRKYKKMILADADNGEKTVKKIPPGTTRQIQFTKFWQWKLFFYPFLLLGLESFCTLYFSFLFLLYYRRKKNKKNEF